MESGYWPGTLHAEHQSLPGLVRRERAVGPVMRRGGAVAVGLCSLEDEVQIRLLLTTLREKVVKQVGTVEGQQLYGLGGLQRAE